jgi:putative transposase
MALSQSDLLRLLESIRTADGVETIRSLCERILQELIEAEATEAIGAAPREHSGERTTWRNGHRERLLTTQAGDLDLKIPKVRTGSFFPSLLGRRRRIDRALFAVVMEAYVHGVSTRSADDLVKALGADSGISKSEVSRICGELDEELTAFKERPLDHTVFPYVFLDATYCKARVNHRIVSQAVVIATGISVSGARRRLGPGRRDGDGRDSGLRELHPSGSTASCKTCFCGGTAIGEGADSDQRPRHLHQVPQARESGDPARS